MKAQIAARKYGLVLRKAFSEVYQIEVQLAKPFQRLTAKPLKNGSRIKLLLVLTLLK